MDYFIIEVDLFCIIC